LIVGIRFMYGLRIIGPIAWGPAKYRLLLIVAVAILFALLRRWIRARGSPR